MTKSSEEKITRKIYIGGKEHEILYSEKKLEEELEKIDELEERKLKIEDCLKLKVRENERISQENERLLDKVEKETNEFVQLKGQLMEDREYYELKRTQFCKKMMRNHKRSVGLLTEDSVESIASRLDNSNSLPSLNCKRLLHLYRQWRMITYNNCENYLRLDQYRNEVITEISTIRREFKKAKFETLANHKESTLQYLYLIGKQRTGKGQIKTHQNKENKIVERMQLLKTENEKLKKLFQDLYDRIGNIGDEEDALNQGEGRFVEKNVEIVDGKLLKQNDSDKNGKRNYNNNSFDTSVTSSSSESTLFNSSANDKDSRISINVSCSSESYGNSYPELPNTGNCGKYSIYNFSNSEVQLNKSTSLELNESDSFISLHDLKKSRKLKTKRHVRFREKAVSMNGEGSSKDSGIILEEEGLPDVLLEKSGRSLLSIEKNNEEILRKDTCSVEDLVKQSWKDEFSEEKLPPRTSSLHSNTSSSLNKHDSGIDNVSISSSLRDLSVDDLIRVQDRIFNLEMNLKLSDCKDYSSKVKMCQERAD